VVCPGVCGRPAVLRLNSAVSVEARTGLDDQFADGHVAIDLPAGHDLQSLGLDAAVEAATDHHTLTGQFAFDATSFADSDLGCRLHATLERPVDMQVIAQGDVADKL